MASKALDLTTIAHALTKLSETFLGECDWIAVNQMQEEFLLWYERHRNEINALSGLEALASTDMDELNRFLTSHGFDPMFQQPPAGATAVGVASILDMLVEWLIEGEPTTLTRYQNSGGVGYLNLQTGVDYPAFDIEPDGVDVLDAPGYVNPILKLATKTGHHLWLMKSDEPPTGLHLAHAAHRIARSEFRVNEHWVAGATIPMLEMNVKPDLEWLIGATAVTPAASLGDEWYIDQAFQQFKLRANAQGARVKVATGMVMVACAAAGPPPPRPYILDDPFIGFFTQPGHDHLPLAAFWADTDVWQNPEGTLEEL